MRRWLTLCLALVLAAGLVPAGGFAEGGRASTSLDGASAGQRGNIALAVEALDGAIVKKGDTFSFNETVGPRTKENGYVSAVNGRGAKKLGGGVSQVATTLYLALKRLEGIQFLQKQTYGNQFTGGYVDTGYDAVVTDSKKNVDFRFVNGYGDFAIRIRTTDASIECELVPPGAESGGPTQSSAAQGGEASPVPDTAPDGGDVDSVQDETPADGSGGDANAVQDEAPASDSGVNSDAVRGETSASGSGGNAGAADDTQADGSDANAGAAGDGAQASGSGEDDEHGRPAPENAGDEPVESAIEDDPDVMGSSHIRIDGPDAMLENIQLASSGIYGVVVRCGGTFSFNALVGPNTEEAGYKAAPDGRGEAVVGGGVSVIASALWLAVRDVDDIDVTKKTTYGKTYSQSYVGDPDDAVRTDYNTGVDFRFRYKGRGSVTIYAYVLEGELICEIRHNNS